MMGCQAPASKEVEEPVSPLGRLKIEEVYYAGSVPTAGIDRYYADQFIQLRNVSDEPILLGGVGIGDLHGLAGAINPGSSPDSFADDPDYVYFGNLWQIPGAPDEVILEGGGCILIAQDAAYHGPYSELDHLDAHYETYVVESEQDDDDPIVDNLDSLFYTAGYDWLITVFGPTIVVVEPSVLEEREVIDVGWTDVLKVPSTGIVDTMEAVMDAESGDFKRLHAELDAGFIHVSGTYTGESVRRVRVDGVLQDQDNSALDYEVSAPVADCFATY